MPQSPLGKMYAQTESGVLVPVIANSDGLLAIAPVETPKTALNKTSASAISTGSGRIAGIIIVAPGSSSGSFTINDCATTGAAAASNVIWTMAYNATANVAGAFFPIDFPFLTGLTLSAVPGSGSPIIAIAYYENI